MEEIEEKRGPHGVLLVLRGKQALGDVSDIIALLFNRTFLAMRRYTEKVHVGNVITETVGQTADSFAEMLNKTIFAGNPHAHHFTGFLAGVWDGVMDAVRRLTHTMSYGLLLFGLGLCLMLVVMMVKSLQNYNFTETFVALLLTLFTMLMIVIALVIAAALVAQLWEFITAVWKEARFYNEV